MQTHNHAQVIAWDMKEDKIYLVYGLYDPLSSLIPQFPFKGRIVFDGLLLGQDIEDGNNILRMMVEEYKEDIESNGIILELPDKD